MTALAKRLRNACLLPACFFVLAPLGHAQGTASISGRVEDASHAAVSGATVTVKSLETGILRVVTTDETGDYRASSLPLGAQEVKVEKPGFKTDVRQGVSLRVGQEATVDFRLEVGEVLQQIDVTEQAPIVNTTTAAIAGVVGEREVKDLPLNGRSFDNLITLNPGAINYSAMKSANTSTSNGNTFSVAGRRTGENLFLLNGIEYTGSSQLAVTPGGVSGELLGIDAVREFNVLTDTYRRRVRQTRGRAGQRGDAIGHQRVARHAVRVSAQQRSRCAQLLRPGVVRSSVPPEISSAARWAARSRKTSCSCSATTKDSARRWR